MIKKLYNIIVSLFNGDIVKKSDLFYTHNDIEGGYIKFNKKMEKYGFVLKRNAGKYIYRIIKGKKKLKIKSNNIYYFIGLNLRVLHDIMSDINNIKRIKEINITEDSIFFYTDSDIYFRISRKEFNSEGKNIGDRIRKYYGMK